MVETVTDGTAKPDIPDIWKKLSCGIYRDRLKGVQILLSRTQAGPGRTVKQEQD